MIKFYTLLLYHIEYNILLGSITYIYDNEDKKIKIQYIEIKDKYINKGYGKLLLLCLFIDLLDKNIYFIHLYDCSDCSCSSNSIYLKFGFSQTEANDEEMYIFFENNTNEYRNIYTKPYRNIKSYKNIKDLLQKNIKNINLNLNYLDNFNESFEIIKIKNNKPEKNITAKMQNILKFF
jgi:hypothetical protein